MLTLCEYFTRAASMIMNTLWRKHNMVESSEMFQFKKNMMILLRLVGQDG